ncbi:MAG: leucine-rich repeat protein, partial [Kiritimatiellia bacterium]
SGIGGGDYGDGGTVTIHGGTVFAQGDDYCAGIGGGDEGNGGTVTIHGGTVTATSAGYGAGIGGGDEGNGGTVTINGGTVFAQGDTGGADIGPGRNGVVAGANTFTGGSICLGGVFIAPEPSNSTVPVFCAVVAGFEPGARVEFTDPGTLPAGFGTTDIFADDGGAIYLWLPNGTYTFTANGHDCTVTIQDGVGPTGVTVNGVDVALGPPNDAAGWAYDAATGILSLTNAGPFMLSGANMIGGVCVVVPEGVTNTVTLSNLTLRATGNGQCAFALETNANVMLLLAGTNTLASGYLRAGLEAAEGRTLSITNAPGDDAGALTVTGGYDAAGVGGSYCANGGAVNINGGVITVTGGDGGAGIGGSHSASGGMVNINGGDVDVTGGWGAAGIGGGYDGIGGTVTVNGGTVTATGGDAGAGIGGGYNYSNIPNADTDSGGTVTVNGGAVTATGGRYAAGIGGGDYGGGGTVNISGGTVTATGGFDGAGIGGGYEGQGGAVTITGGGVSATGGDYAPGIGGGFVYDSTNSIAGWGGTVAISGGRVMATGGRYAAGIGGGSGWTVEGGDGADLTVSGGTVFATGGADGGPGVGSGVGNVENGGTPPQVSGTCTFTGGSIRILGGYAAADPTDTDSERVWCVTVTNLTPNAEITVESLDPYGVNDLYADEAGKLYLWLPNDYYDFSAGGAGYEVTVSDADTTATPKSTPPPAPRAYITFSSTDTFKVKPGAKTWNGTLECSTNATDWVEFTTAGADAALDDGSGEYRLYLCGTNNTVITGDYYAPAWTITADGAVACSGNIETLLDYTTVLAGQHPAMGNYCFANLFKDCTALVGAPELPAANLASRCYQYMFAGCTALTAAPELPATTLPSSCYYFMFRGCTALASAPELPATTLSGSCYSYMFYGCTNLTNAPALPATTLAPDCYYGMFFECTALTEAPALPATNLADACYASMFGWCSELTQAPPLPVETLAPHCYASMFSGCTSLTEAPTLPATNLTAYCYASMFSDCTSLTNLPALPARKLAYSCYASMFKNCTGIKLYTEGSGPIWGIPEGAMLAGDWNKTMLAGTSGTFTGDPVPGATYYYDPTIPPPSTAYLTFSGANAFTITPSAVSWNGDLFYSTNTTDWIAFDRDGATAALDSGSGDYRLHFRGAGNTLVTGGNLAYWTINAAPASVDCSGNIETLLDYATVEADGHPAMIANCFANLFKDCTALASAPELPATNLIDNCYVGMFRGCTGLTNAPALPATTLPGGCYQEMFRDCTSLVQAPALPAMTLPSSCYKGMFTNCTALATAPELPATTLGATCYQYMFAGCTSLTNAPALQATTLAPGCYHSMFRGCTALTRLPELPATTLAVFCYAFMFTDCTDVALHETGTAPTWGIPDAQTAIGWNTNMLAGTGGTFTGDPVPGDIYYYTPSTPTPRTYVTFTSASAFSIKPQEASWDGTLEYSTDATDWTAFTTNAAAVAAADGDGTFTLHFSGTGNSRISPNDMGLSGWILAADGDVAATGDIGSLLDYATVANGGQPAVATYAFANLFSGWTALTSAPELPAADLARGCYYGMFRGCTSLAETPELPATNLARSCYASMFSGCTALTNLPTLAATTLAESCYASMFKDCIGITLHETGTAPTWGIPDAQTATGWNADMLDGTGGTFTG